MPLSTMAQQRLLKLCYWHWAPEDDARHARGTDAEDLTGPLLPGRVGRAVAGDPEVLALARGEEPRAAQLDVARIEVLKDAAATSMYGSRGANGVIVITTKRAR